MSDTGADVETNATDDDAVEPFEDAVHRVVGGTASGEVITYGEVAVEAGRPGAARAVGTVLARTGRDLPWWRVVKSTGHLAAHKQQEQADRLGAEGVTVVDGRIPGMGRR